MTTKLATAKVVSQQKANKKPVDTTITDSSIPVQEGASAVDDNMSSGQAGACCGKVNDFSIKHAARELEDSQDTHSGLTRYQKVGTATTFDTSDTLVLDTSVCTTACPKVTFDSFCQTNLSTIDPNTRSEDDEGDSEPTLKMVHKPYRQLKLKKNDKQHDIIIRNEQFTSELRGRCDTQAKESDQVQ